MLRQFFAIVMGLIFSVAVVGPPALADGAAVQLPGDPKIVNLILVEQSLLDLTNADRAANGIDALTFDPQMIGIARQRAEIQLGSQGLSHYDAAGRLVFVDLLQGANLSYQLAGENLARSSTDDATVTTRVEQALMQSPLHRKNILEPAFTRVSVGVAVDATGQITFAEIYRN